MSRNTRYTPELRERAVRMAIEKRADYPSEWATFTGVAKLFGMSPETLRTWVRRDQVDHGTRVGLTADERARLIREDGLSDDSEITAKLAIWSDRMTHYQEHRIHPQLPDKNVLCFYPMLKRRDGADNWYALPFDDRKRLMGGHAKTGRSYAGRVIQLITGATGLDDWEWGVTLFADDPVVIKDIVHEMRFDEVSARYAEFGTFVVGLCGQAVDVFAAVGLTVRSE